MHISEYDKWKNLVLLKNNSCCSHCSTFIELPHVMHIEPPAFAPAREFDVDNGVVICYTCYQRLYGMVWNERTGKHTFVFDLDGTICENKPSDGSYADVKPMIGAVHTLKRLKDAGHTIIICTARHDRTFRGNKGKILANIGYLYDWLRKWNIPFDELRFDKVHATAFIDDKGYRHINWDETSKFIDSLLEGSSL